jgi:predicted Zn-dependent peptidase
MRSLAVNQSNLDNQRNAVQEERRLGEDNQPYGHAESDIDNLAYDNFPYKHSTIGSMADLNAASVDDVKEFFRIYYAPNNAVLTLVGDLDPAETGEEVLWQHCRPARGPAGGYDRTSSLRRAQRDHP